MFAVRLYGDPVLRRKAKPVAVFDDRLRAFAVEMAETMRTEDGVGLAAPQVGESIRLVVIDATQGQEPPIHLVNPVITWRSEECEDYEEGCLSVPNIRLMVNRPSRVSVDAVDASGKPFSITEASGLLARALQHEIDHLDGFLFVDRVSPAQRLLVNGKLKKLARSQRSESVTSRATAAA